MYENLTQDMKIKLKKIMKIKKTVSSTVFDRDFPVGRKVNAKTET